MREFAFEMLSEISGLRPDVRASRQSPYLVEAKNVEVQTFGLEAYTPVINPFGSQSVDFPWPQIIEGQNIMFGDGDYPILLNTNTVPWEKQATELWDMRNVGEDEVPLIHDGEWHVASFLDDTFFFNGTQTIVRSHRFPGKLIAQSDVTIRTGCASKGRIIVGGFDKNDAWHDWWRTFLGTMSGQIMEPDLAENWVMWSSIGAGDFPMWLFDGYYPSQAAFFEAVKRNEFGWMQMRWRGNVQKVLPLGDGVMVYGEGGVSALIPTERVHDMASTYGLQEVVSAGVPQRDCVGGDEMGHIFIDDSGSLWSVGGNLQATRLGFEEYLFPLLGGPIRITLDRRRREFRICSDEVGYILTDRGLSQIGQRVTSSFHFKGGVVGLFEDEGEDESAYIVTSEIDMSTASIKTITTLSVDYRSSEDVFVAVDYKYHRNEDWKRSKWVVLNREGNARVNVSGLEFRIAVMTMDYEGFELDRIQVRWQKSDKRITRGPDADPSVTGAGE